MNRRNLVIVRAGDHSLHTRWLEGAGDRNWDIIVSYFGDDPDKHRRSDIIRIDSKGPKWPALQKLIEAQENIISAYEYIWLPDDDLNCDKCSINRFFEICRDHNLSLAQPALTHSSYFGHPETLRVPLLRVRITNFVEIMAPCFQVALLFAYLPTMGISLSGWGLDWLWSKMSFEDGVRVGIVDAVSVHHTRPIGGPNYRFVREEGYSPRQEMLAICSEHGINERVICVETAISSVRDIRISGTSSVLKILSWMTYASAVVRYPLRTAVHFLPKDLTRWETRSRFQALRDKFNG